jgi:hypothetical protein
LAIPLSSRLVFPLHTALELMMQARFCTPNSLTLFVFGKKCIQLVGTTGLQTLEQVGRRQLEPDSHRDRAP